MYRIGLTGSIGSGKSTVSQFIREKGIPIIDADDISRRITSNPDAENKEYNQEYNEEDNQEKSQVSDPFNSDLREAAREVLTELRDAFGDGIITGEILDRRALAAMAFATEEGKAKLTSIVTDKVKDIIEERTELLENAGAELVVMDIPLLFENKMESSFDEVWSVAADTDLRFARAHARDGIDRDDFDRRDGSQVSQDYKIANSDVVFMNDGSPEELKAKVEREIERVRCHIDRAKTEEN